MIKDLTINGQVFAKYEIEKDILFLHTIIKIIPENETEEVLANIIKKIEHVEINKIAYLNI